MKTLKQFLRLIVLPNQIFEKNNIFKIEMLNCKICKYKLRFIYAICILNVYLSCKIENNKTLIYAINDERKKSGLNEFNINFNLDSTFRTSFDEKDWGVVEFLKDYKDELLTNNDKKSNYSIIEYYSNKGSQLSKIVYFNVIEGQIFLISEQDKYYKNIGDTINVFLNHNHNFRENKNIFSVDSTPTNLLITRNKAKLEEMSDYASKNNLELCGTAANEILKEGFPQKHTIIDSIQFLRLKTKLYE